MSKLIDLTPEIKQALIKKFTESLETNGKKCQDGVFTFSAKVSTAKDRKATVFMEPLAWLKMWALVDHYESEIAWYGLARRGDDPEKDEYIISDIVVYPQIVDGTNVDTDDKVYDEWHKALDPKVWNAMAMQGHSHVNMATFASGTDLKDQKEILDVLTGDMFYIFLIVNKARSVNAKVYDLEKNVLFEKEDVTLKLSDERYDLSAFLKQAEGLVRRRTYATSLPNYANPGKGYSGYSKGSYPGYSGNYSHSDHYKSIYDDDYDDDTPANPSPTVGASTARPAAHTPAPAKSPANSQNPVGADDHIGPAARTHGSHRTTANPWAADSQGTSSASPSDPSPSGPAARTPATAKTPATPHPADPDPEDHTTPVTPVSPSAYSSDTFKSKSVGTYVPGKVISKPRIPADSSGFQQ